MQQYLSIDFLILYALLGITLLIGLCTSRSVKDIREYAASDKMFTTSALVLTYLATEISGENVLNIPLLARKKGIMILLICMAWIFSYLVQGLIIAPRFFNFRHCLTLGDVMKELYKGPSQVITGILSVVKSIAIVGMEITILGILSQKLLGIDLYWGVIMSGIVLVLYTAHGGIKAVTYTDAFHFLILMVIIPIITIKALEHAGGIHEVLNKVPASRFDYHHPSVNRVLPLCCLLGIFQIKIINPPVIQRILMAETKTQIRDLFLMSGLVLLLVALSLFLLGLTSIVLFPDYSGNYIVPHLIHQLLPTGLKGVAFAGMFAISMATFDSYLHSTSLTLVHDVIAPIYNRKGKVLNELRLTRAITLIVGFLMIGVGLLSMQDLYLFSEISYLVISPFLTFPLFAGILGLKPDKYAFYIAAIVTLVTILVAKLIIIEERLHVVTLVSICTNGLTFFLVHVIRNKGFDIVKYEQQERNQV
jgi:Na+/proline symporter